MYEFISFDCYGTLIDWEGGISAAIAEAARMAGVDVRAGEIMRAYLQVEPTIQAAEYRSYRDILGEAASKTARLLGWAVDPRDAGFLAESLPTWKPFADTNSALEKLKAAGYRLGILSNIDDDLLCATVGHFTVDFDLVVTAESVRSYKPAHAHFLRARESLTGSRWLHAAQSYFHDVEPACELGIPVVWVNRNEDSPTGVVRPTGEVRSLAELVSWLKSTHPSAAVDD